MHSQPNLTCLCLNRLWPKNHARHSPILSPTPLPHRYLEKKDWEGAYRIACLGVTDADWRALALAALQVRARVTAPLPVSTVCMPLENLDGSYSLSLAPLRRAALCASHARCCLYAHHDARRPMPVRQAMEVEVARRAFVRVRDLRAVELVDRVAAGLNGGLPRGLLGAEVLAWQVRAGP